jgi:tetratricopeptide (TPR) repeat protein
MMDPKNSTFIHTQAEVARKRANSEISLVLKEQLRRRARFFLDKMSKQDRFAVSSRCKLLVDEIAELSDGFGDDERTVDDQFFADKLRETETALTRAQQEFPDDAEMVESEARLWNEMKDKGRALRALERAWKKMPRGSGTAIRIGKIYATAGRRDDQHKVLAEALDRNPDDKGAHFAMAMHMLAGELLDKSSIVHHLSNSFQLNDANFEARFILGQFFFSIGNLDRYVSLFAEIDKRAPSGFRRFCAEGR